MELHFTCEHISLKLKNAIHFRLSSHLSLRIEKVSGSREEDIGWPFNEHKSALSKHFPNVFNFKNSQSLNDKFRMCHDASCDV